MSQVALIVHELMGSPDRWRQKGDGTISNGYYIVGLNGLSYGMGAAIYQSTGSEIDMLRKGIEDWKRETNWTPPEQSAPPLTRAETKQARTTPDLWLRKAYEEFGYTVRSLHRAYKVHLDPTVLACGLEEAIIRLDTAIRPVEMIEGKKRNQDGGLDGQPGNGGQ